MKEYSELLALNRWAVLNAVVLSFLSIQFIMPFAFVLLLWIIPVIFALQVFYVSPKQALLSGMLMVLLSSLLFGLDLGAWTLVYFLAGSVLGITSRRHSSIVARLLSTGLAFGLSISFITLVFAWLAQVGWQEIRNVLEGISLLRQLPLIPILLLGLIVWAMSLAILSDRFLIRILRQLQLDLR